MLGPDTIFDSVPVRLDFHPDMSGLQPSAFSAHKEFSRDLISSLVSSHL